MDKQFFKIEDVAKILDVSPWTVRKWIKQRKIRTYRFGGAVRLKISDIMLFAQISQSLSEITPKMLEK
jgi:excisionase family DNA binding protein